MKAEHSKNMILAFTGSTAATTTFVAVGANIPASIFATLSKSDFLLGAFVLGALAPGLASGLALGKFIVNRMPNLRRKRFALKNAPETEDNH